MAKKTINEQIEAANLHLKELDQQSKAIQEEKKLVKQQIKTLNDQLVAELGRQLLNKMDLQDASAEDIEAAFKQLDNIKLEPSGDNQHADY